MLRTDGVYTNILDLAARHVLSAGFPVTLQFYPSGIVAYFPSSWDLHAIVERETTWENLYPELLEHVVDPEVVRNPNRCFWSTYQTNAASLRISRFFIMAVTSIGLRQYLSFFGEILNDGLNLTLVEKTIYRKSTQPPSLYKVNLLMEFVKFPQDSWNC